jgi:phytepsin
MGQGYGECMSHLFSLVNKTLSSLSYELFKIAGVSIAKQPFAVISSANGMNTSEFDGILGMGYQQIANGGENPVIWSMYLAGELQQPIFGFWFGP